MYNQMKASQNRIRPGIGLGEIQFGMIRSDVLEILGLPDAIEITSHTDWPDNKSEVWLYGKDELTLSFDEDHNWRLGLITINEGNFNLYGVIYLNQQIGEIKSNLEDIGFKQTIFQDWSCLEIPSHKLIRVDNRSMNFWFDDDKLMEIQWGPIFKDEDTIIWPYQSNNSKKLTSLEINIYDPVVLFDKLDFHLKDRLTNIFLNKDEYAYFVSDFPFSTERENLSTKSISIKYYLRDDLKVKGSILVKARLLHNERGDIGWMATEYDNELNVLDDFLVIEEDYT